jgi:Uma2 family endonuclease
MAAKPTRKSKEDGAAGKKSKSKTQKPKSANVAAAKPKMTRRKPAEAHDSKTKAKTQTESPNGKSAHSHNGKAKTTRRDGQLAKKASHSDGGKTQTRSQKPKADGKVKPDQPQTEMDEGRIASTLFQALESYANSHGLGRVARETHFDWGEVETHDLRPDMAFVSFDRWARYRFVPHTFTWHVVPDLVVEIVHESEKTKELATKLTDYFKAGVNRVWVVYPRDLRILDYQSPSEHQILNRDKSIDGGTILPGFRLPVSELVGKEK